MYTKMPSGRACGAQALNVVPNKLSSVVIMARELVQLRRTQAAGERLSLMVFPALLVIEVSIYHHTHLRQQSPLRPFLGS